MKYTTETTETNSLRPQRDTTLVRATALEAVWLSVAAIAITWAVAMAGNIAIHMMLLGVLVVWPGPNLFNIAIAASLITAMMTFGWKIWVTMALGDWQDYTEYKATLKYVSELEELVTKLRADLRFWKRQATASVATSKSNKVEPKPKATDEIGRNEANAKCIIDAWVQGFPYSRGNVSNGRGGKLTDDEWYAATNLMMRAGIMEDRKGNKGRTILARSESEALAYLSDQIEQEREAATANKVLA